MPPGGPLSPGVLPGVRQLRSASIPVILEFLQDGLDKGLAPNTLRRQVVALSTILAPEGHHSLSRHPTIHSFLRGATNLSPPMVHRYPTWDLNVVLQALVEPPFEPLSSASLKHLTFKTVFLIAITSARRISELAAMSVYEDLCLFHQDMVILWLDPSFMPKINSWFHQAQEVIFPDFCPHPRHLREECWHKLDIRRTLLRYIKCTASFRRSESLFVSFQPSSQGKKVSSSTIGGWLRGCITLAHVPQS
ncbi:uncharacterized protein LOC116510084 [Thamnophis elegans]|uniref:uncharacterized protein LOC116510084 n=1 Tax=Thamnophis elegans TaxID=35005 RepID=UPI001376EC3E|nr:uncharacterized protein LOC116510084 [Thamnophis elegans]